MIKDFWNDHSQEYARIIQEDLASEKNQAWKDYILKELPDHTPLNILDIGR